MTEPKMQEALRSGAASGRLSPLIVDLYELTMAQSYVNEAMDAEATFSLFVRNLPRSRAYLVAAGLESALDFLETLSFSPDEISFVSQMGLFTEPLLDRLRSLRFTGSVRALPEGTICFGDEPLLEVTAPMIEAQLVESVLLNELQLQTMIASKASRSVQVAQGRRLVDFALRRTHGSETSLRVARASYLAGFEATSNVRASQLWGIPPAGTMAHSYVEAFADELTAFRAYTRAFPHSGVLLIDTYDTLQGAHHAAIVGQELAQRGYVLRGVRLDSGDLLSLSLGVRAILDAAGLNDTIVFASGNLDEYEIERLLAEGAPIDGFGVGTRMGVSSDAPYLEIAYKLVSYDGRPTLKLSSGKESWPGPKQIWRRQGPAGFQGDWLGLADEAGPEGTQPLLIEVMAHGRRTVPPEPLSVLQARCAEGLASLPPSLRRLREADPYPVTITEKLRSLQQASLRRLRDSQAPG